jgi:hypothetical protein
MADHGDESGAPLDGNVLSRDIRVICRRCGIKNASVQKTPRIVFRSDLGPPVS